MQRMLNIFAASLFATAAIANEEIDIADVPAAVYETAIEYAPGADFYRVSIEYENGEKIYEFEAEDHQGRHIEVDVLEDGTLSEIEMEITVSDLPSDITDAMQAIVPGFEPDYVEISVRSGYEIVYEFEGSYNGDPLELEIAESGEVVYVSAEALS